MSRRYIIERRPGPVYFHGAPLFFLEWVGDAARAKKYKSIAAAGKDIRRYGLRAVRGVAEIVRAPE